MKIRYKKGKGGVSAVARVYSASEHGIDINKVDRDAVRVVERLRDAGFETYIVGGAVRDLILGNVPKDFDVATAASPRQVHRLFYSSRIIGRRFRIVHVAFGDKIIEVSTFRSTREHGEADNVYGTVEEDASRRDFSINSLYYDPVEQTVVDFNNAMADVRAGRITSLIPLNRTFIEDPVRMIRALKYSVTTGFRLRTNIKRAIRRYAPELEAVSTSRLTEELNKILSCGYSSRIILLLYGYGLLQYMLPCFSVYAKNPAVEASLSQLDARICAHRANADLPEVQRSDEYLALTAPLISLTGEFESPHEEFKDIFRQMKVLLSPNTPPNYDLEAACLAYMKQSGLELPKAQGRQRSKPDRKTQNRRSYRRRRKSSKAASKTPELAVAVQAGTA